MVARRIQKPLRVVAGKGAPRRPQDRKEDQMVPAAHISRLMATKCDVRTTHSLAYLRAKPYHILSARSGQELSGSCYTQASLPPYLPVPHPPPPPISLSPSPPEQASKQASRRRVSSAPSRRNMLGVTPSRHAS